MSVITRFIKRSITRSVKRAVPRSVSRRPATRIATALLAAAAALTTAVVAPTAGASAGSRPDDALARARAATAKYHSIATAEQSGYGMLIDAAGITCIAEPGQGAMGVHWVSSTLVGDSELHVRKPEAVVYAPSRNGTLKLAALEYIVFQSAWQHDRRPRLFGHQFTLTTSPNRFGLPPFYSLHVWIWKHNPAGLFAMWNPRVHCGRT